MSETTTPNLTTVILDSIAAVLSDVNVALPARVETYDATTQQVTVQPLIYEGYKDEAGMRQTRRRPVVTGVPVVFPGAGGFRVTFPVTAGDTVLIVCGSASFDRWLALGGEVDPQDDRAFHLTDAVAIPGLRSFASPLSSAPTSTMSLGKDGGPTIEISATDIQAGGSSALVTQAQFMNHTHVTAGTGPPTPPTSISPTPTLTGTTILKGA